MTQQGCIHSDVKDSDGYVYTDELLACGRRIVRLVHGFLCITHYREQQDAMGPFPRKSKYFQYAPGEVESDILKTEAEAIQRGKIESVFHAGTIIKFWQEA